MNERITSTTNPRIKELARLKDRKGRTESGRFLIEGHRELGLAVAAGVDLEEVVLATEFASRRELDMALRLRNEGVQVVEVGSAAFEKLSVRQHPDGLLGVAVRHTLDLDGLDLGTSPVVLVLDGIEKPGNLGGMLRSADAAGVDAVIVTDGAVEPVNPNTIRASQGAVFTVPLVETSARAAREWLDRHEIRIVAASPEAETTLWDADLTGSIAIAVGSEAHGLGPAFRSPGVIVRIPMAGAADSLNASVSVGIMLFEAVRQRR